MLKCKMMQLDLILKIITSKQTNTQTQFVFIAGHHILLIFFFFKFPWYFYLKWVYFLFPSVLHDK